MKKSLRSHRRHSISSRVLHINHPREAKLTTIHRILLLVKKLDPIQRSFKEIRAEQDKRNWMITS